MATAKTLRVVPIHQHSIHHPQDAASPSSMYPSSHLHLHQPSRINTSLSSSSSSHHLHHHQSNKDVQSHQTTQSEKNITASPTNKRTVSKRVALWDTLNQRKISGFASPIQKNLVKYLAAHPHCIVYATYIAKKKKEEARRLRRERRAQQGQTEMSESSSSSSSSSSSDSATDERDSSDAGTSDSDVSVDRHDRKREEHTHASLPSSSSSSSSSSHKSPTLLPHSTNSVASASANSLSSSDDNSTGSDSEASSPGDTEVKSASSTVDDAEDSDAGQAQFQYNGSDTQMMKMEDFISPSMSPSRLLRTTSDSAVNSGSLSTASELSSPQSFLAASPTLHHHQHHHHHHHPHHHQHQHQRFTANLTAVSGLLPLDPFTPDPFTFNLPQQQMQMQSAFNADGLLDATSPPMPSYSIQQRGQPLSPPSPLSPLEPVSALTYLSSGDEADQAISSSLDSSVFKNMMQYDLNGSPLMSPLSSPHFDSSSSTQLTPMVRSLSVMQNDYGTAASLKPYPGSTNHEMQDI